MFRKRGLEKSSAILVLAIGAILAYSWFLAPSLLFIELALISLGVFSVFVLTDILVSWLIILGIACATVILISDVAYFTDIQVIFLMYTFSLIVWLAHRVNYYLHGRLSIVQDTGDQAQKDYTQLRETVHLQEEKVFQALLIHWSHYLQFFQISPREYKWVLKQIRRILRRDFPEDSLVHYVSDGNFLILLSDEEVDLKEYFQERIKPQLLRIHFRNKQNHQKIQFQSAYLSINSKNKDKFAAYEDTMKNLERQLETDIIIEY